jgi:hypothetical protein
MHEGILHRAAENVSYVDTPINGLDEATEEREIPNMKTLTADKYKRLRIPDAKPRQVFAYANNGDGSFTLTVVKAERKESFPRASLLKYLTPKRDKEQLRILSACLPAPLKAE